MMRLRLAILLSIVIVPTLTLIPLGSYWLWQNGLVVPWVLSALAFTIAMYGMASLRLTQLTAPPAAKPANEGTASLSPEDAAWFAVERLGEKIDPTSIKSRGDLLDVAVLTIETVAREFHPGDKTPVWNFTVPEMLLVTERVANRLRPMFTDNVPLGEHLTVGQMMRVYEWRSLAGVAEGAYDLWRLVRVVNPIAAVTQEARERVTKQILTSLRDDFTRRIVRMLVDEVGSAAIELYSGRLRASSRPGLDGEMAAAAARAKERVPPRAKSRIGTALGEIGKLARGSRALYWRKPRIK